MKIEIWSDVMCPFCYIGKRKLEKALEAFEGKNNVEVEWKSFQLNPQLQTDATKNTVAHLAESKGWSLEYAQGATDHVTRMAAEEGLEYHLDKAVVANSFDAHRMIQYAKTQGKGDAAEERLFRAYFTEGKNTADHSVLVQLGTDIGLDAATLQEILSGDDFAIEVSRDIQESRNLGVTGVPFFVIDRKYAVSGAQPVETFLSALRKAAD